MGIINPAKDGAKRQGINANTNAQINIKSGEALVLSTQPQTYAQLPAPYLNVDPN